MEIPIPPRWKDLWEEWDIRVFILLSLTLQTFMILVAPLRKRISSHYITMTLWSSYLLADWAANLTVGFISSTQSEKNGENKSGSGDSNNADLLSFWAPFLLVHLGGPDTITAFALEDNELWLRHLLGLVFQSLATVYIFFLSLPKNNLWIPSVLMFISGIIKYVERTRSLYLASLDSFRDSLLTEPDPGPNYAKLMTEYSAKREAKLPTRIAMLPEPDRRMKAMNKAIERDLNEDEVVLYGHFYFQKFKGLIVDLIFSFRERSQSREFFLKRKATDAFKVVEVELNFMYENLFTKFPVVYAQVGYIARFVSFIATIGAIALFHIASKSDFNKIDVGITYTLLYGALGLDIISLIMLCSSDWFKVIRGKLPDDNLFENSKVNDSSMKEKKEEVEPDEDRSIFRRLFKRRWSESISEFNLIYYCLNSRSALKETLIEYLGMKNFFNSVRYVKANPFGNNLKKFIFDELKIKAEMAEDLETAKEVSAARGDWVLRLGGHTELLEYIINVEYDQSLLLWHIATELCHNHDDDEEGKRLREAKKLEKEKLSGKAKKLEMSWGKAKKLDPRETPIDEIKKEEVECRKMSKLLSDYMIYLLYMQPTMMSAVTGIGLIRFRDTWAEAKKFFDEGKGKQQASPAWWEVLIYVLKSFLKTIWWVIIVPLSFIFAVVLFFSMYIGSAIGLIVKRPFVGAGQPKWWEEAYTHSKVVIEPYVKAYKGEGRDEDEEQHIACMGIYKVNTQVEPVTVKGDRSKSVLFDGCRLAKILMSEQYKEYKWKLLAQVWVELMSYAACHCRANAHAQQLSKGGELISIVWLLMAFRLVKDMQGLNLL